MHSHYSPDLVNNPWIQAMAKVLEDHPQVASQIGRPTGGQRAKIVAVDDPEERGRVRVIFDPYNREDLPAQTGAGGEYEGRQGESQTSHWVDCCPAFKGRQPPGLIGKRVLVNTTDGQLHYAVLGDVLQDPEVLTTSAAKKLKPPNNSAMTRLPVYPANQLPPPVAENIGCTVIEEGGPMGSDWLCVCLKRNGKYFWVRHVDLSHAHAGGDDGVQPPSASGARQNPVYMGCTSSHVSVTTGIQHIPNSSFSQRPAGNPFGDACAQPLPPMSKISDPTLKFKPLKDFELLKPDPKIALDFVRGPASYFEGAIAGFRAKFNPEIPLLYEADAKTAFSTAQSAAAAASAIGQAISNPQEFVVEQSLAFAEGASEGLSIPPGTKAALDSVTTTGNLITKSLKAVASIAVGGVLDAVKSALT